MNDCDSELTRIELERERLRQFIAAVPAEHACELPSAVRMVLSRFAQLSAARAEIFRRAEAPINACMLLPEVDR